MIKYLLAVPVLIGVPTTIYGIKRRSEFLADPVMQRAILNLQNDKRVIDFCGENIQPGWIISKKQQPSDNWVKYDLTVKGMSGKLRTTVIGDYLKHNELEILEQEREQYFNEKQQTPAVSQDLSVQKSVEEQAKSKAEEYIPVDFDAYSILDKETQNQLFTIDRSKLLSPEERIWRISSLTTFVDDETKILILPLPESKRKIKIMDTKYNFKTYGDLFQKEEEIYKELTQKDQVVRFEDKTSEEIQGDIKKRRRTQISQMNKIRTYQFVGMAGAGFIYVFVYRRFFSGKSVMNSVIYHQSMNYIKASKRVQNILGEQMQVMNCNGKIWPLKNDVNFDLIIFGSNQKGKVRVATHFDKQLQQWKINEIEVITKNQNVQIV
eukprot:403336275